MAAKIPAQPLMPIIPLTPELREAPASPDSPAFPQFADAPLDADLPPDFPNRNFSPPWPVPAEDWP